MRQRRLEVLWPSGPATGELSRYVRRCYAVNEPGFGASRASSTVQRHESASHSSALRRSERSRIDVTTTPKAAGFSYSPDQSTRSAMLLAPGGARHHFCVSQVLRAARPGTRRMRCVFAGRLQTMGVAPSTASIIALRVIHLLRL